VHASDGTWLEADHGIDGGASVLYDAVALLVSPEGAGLLARIPSARDFVADAYAHAKYIGYTDGAAKLLTRAGIGETEWDAGLICLNGAGDSGKLLKACRGLRFWEREHVFRSWQ
jgi:catalase